jgi:hypothetical protein
MKDKQLIFYREPSKTRLPPDRVEGYVDTEAAFRWVTNPEVVVERARKYARAVLDLRPGERIFRSPQEHVPAPEGSEQKEERPWRPRAQTHP